MDIGERVRKFRKQAGLKIVTLAEMVSASRVYISNIERDKEIPTLKMLDKICSALGLTFAEFFSNQTFETPHEIRQVMEKIKRLSPRQLQILNATLDEWKIDEPAQIESEFKQPRGHLINFRGYGLPLADSKDIHEQRDIAESQEQYMALNNQDPNENFLEIDDIDISNIVLVAHAEGREERRKLSPELQAIVKDAIKVSRQKRQEVNKKE